MSLTISKESSVEGRATVTISNRGKFSIEIKGLRYNPDTMISPRGEITIKTALSDGDNGTFFSKGIFELISYGKHQPTCIVSCIQSSNRNIRDSFPKGSKLWLFIGSNIIGKDISTINFLIYDRIGNRINYGSGTAKTGFITIAPSGS